MIFGKQTELAIAAMSYLAEIHEREPNAATSPEIAQARALPKPFVAKVLTTLAQRGLVTGTQGRKGGYALARAPEQITLMEIAGCFERALKPVQCPFGPAYCGNNTPCPLHDDISRLYAENLAFLENTTLAVFAPKERPAARRARK